jgi:hypothetical protein
LVRKIKGEAFTTRLEITRNLLLHLIDIDLRGLDSGFVERHQEIPPAEPSDRGGLPLRDQPLVIPLDGRRNSHILGKLLGRAPQRRERIIRHLNGYRGHFILLSVPSS